MTSMPRSSSLLESMSSSSSASTSRLSSSWSIGASPSLVTRGDWPPPRGVSFRRSPTARSSPSFCRIHSSRLRSWASSFAASRSRDSSSACLDIASSSRRPHSDSRVSYCSSSRRRRSTVSCRSTCSSSASRFAALSCATASRTRALSASASSSRCCFMSSSSEISRSRRLLVSSISSTSSDAIRTRRSHSSASASCWASFSRSAWCFRASPSIVWSLVCRAASSSVRAAMSAATWARWARLGSSQSGRHRRSTRPETVPTWALMASRRRSARSSCCSHLCCIAPTEPRIRPPSAAHSSLERGARGVRGVESPASSSSRAEGKRSGSDPPPSSHMRL
mmetsp:Transcript_1624/g.3388  ORF Transcript_1624/g.3388 Transcript_1624/m.3388 type:complete len:337 (-) Transcript_1624:151-1161(-)